MLKLDNVRIIEEHQVHGDDSSPTTFYVLPRFPRLARLENGGVALRFVEYSALREADGKKFGGFVAFDVDLAIPPATVDAIKAKLDDELKQQFPDGEPPKASLAPVPWLGGSVRLLLERERRSRREGAGRCRPVAGRQQRRLLPDGAQPARDGDLQGHAEHGQGVGHPGHLLAGLLLPTAGDARDRHLERLGVLLLLPGRQHRGQLLERGQLHRGRSAARATSPTSPRPSSPSSPTRTSHPSSRRSSRPRSATRSTTSSAEAVKRNLMQAIADVDPNVKSLNEDQDIEDIRRTVNKTQIANVSVEWKEAKAVVMDVHPQGMLPTVTSLKDADGNALEVGGLLLQDQRRRVPQDASWSTSGSTRTSTTCRSTASR